jgi:integrase
LKVQRDGRDLKVVVTSDGAGLVSQLEPLQAGPRRGHRRPPLPGRGRGRRLLGEWTINGYRCWRAKTFERALGKLGPGWAEFRPYDLRHKLASRLLAERRNPVEVAGIMGHSVQIRFSTYAHFIAELRAA